MRDLTSIELGNIYGAGGCGCSPTPPSCTKGGSKAKGSTSCKAASKPKGGSKAKGGSKGNYCR